MYKKILVAIDGSDYSLTGGQIALSIAKKLGAQILASNVYDAQIHTRRFHEMESILPGQYREADTEEQLREVHNVWTNEGFLALSKKRLSPYIEMCNKAGVEPVEVNRQGRNYVEILKAAEETGADLIIMGAAGIGAVDNQWGSTAARVLRMANCDVMLARKMPANGDIVVGIDGSEEAEHALERAGAWAGALEKEIVLSAVYDPYFHNRVLESLEGASSAYETSYHEEIYKAVETHGDAEQYAGGHTQTAVQEAHPAASHAESEDGGHDQMVDEGLAKLYEGFLQRAASSASREFRSELLKGKPYQRLAEHAHEASADLVVTGRNGLHKSEFSSIGSNAEGLARMADTNVLIVK
jgi:nucleotide-binding universal stress UspA family protein